MSDDDGCVRKGALDIANALFFVFMLNEATDLEWEKTLGIETGCGCGCGFGSVVYVNELQSGFHLSEKLCHGI